MHHLDEVLQHWWESDDFYYLILTDHGRGIDSQDEYSGRYLVRTRSTWRQIQLVDRNQEAV
jgi:hypothetical protein